jgi:hypothetical protein
MADSRQQTAETHLKSGGRSESLFSLRTGLVVVTAALA